MSWRKKEFKGKYLRDTNFSWMRVWKESEDDFRWVDRIIADEFYIVDGVPTLNEIQAYKLLCLLRSLGIKSAHSVHHYISYD